MKRFVMVVILASSLVGCSMLDYITLSEDSGQYGHYAKMVALTETLSEHCGESSKIVQSLPEIRLEAKTAYALAQTSPNEIKEASGILNKMVDEFHSKYADATKVPSTKYCELKLKNITDTSQKMLNTLRGIGG